jgi:multiple sugar transport system substrate-binding protein
MPEKLLEEEKPTTIKTEETVRQTAATSATGPKDDFWSKYGKWVAIVAGVLILVLIIVLVATSKTPKKQETVTLNYWGLWENEEIMNGVISDFEAKNPLIKVNYKRNQISNYRTRLASRLAKTGTSDNEDVDIFRIHNTWIPMFKDYLASVPTSKVTSIGLDTDFFDVYAKDLKENGKWLSVPLMYDGLALFYNKDLLQKANIEVPKSWWELNEAASKLTTKNDSGTIQMAGAGIGVANGNVEHWSDILGIMMKQNGIDFAKKTNMDSNLEDALKYYASFARSGQSVWDDSLPNATELFANGKLAFYFGNSWRVFDLATLNKDLNYGITTVPQLPINGDITDRNAELTNIHWASYWAEGVNSKSKHQEEAWKFLEYLSSKEVLEKLYSAESQVRAFGEIYPRKSMMNELKDNVKVWPFVSVANNAESWYVASSTDDDGLNSEMQKYFTDAINSLNDYASNTDIMTALKNGIAQLQQKYSLKR